MHLSDAQLARLRALGGLDDDEDDEDDGSEFDPWPIVTQVSSPLEMYFVPWILNWGDRDTEKIVRWILDSPLCDAGTALAIYWLNCPVNWVGKVVSPDQDEWENDQIEFSQALEDRIRLLQFPHQDIAFDPHSFRKYWNEDGSERRDLSLVPADMKRPTPGLLPPSMEQVGL